MPTHQIDKPSRHPNPKRDPLKDRRDTSGIELPANLMPPNQPSEYRPF
jgi:hypothetical protein